MFRCRSIVQKIFTFVLANIFIFWLAVTVIVPTAMAQYDTCAAQGGLCGNSVCGAPRPRQIVQTSDCSGVDPNGNPLYCCSEDIPPNTPTCVSQLSTCRRSCESTETQIIGTCPPTGRTQVCCKPPPCKPEGFEQSDTTCGEWLSQQGNRCCEPYLSCQTWLRDNNTRSGIKCVKTADIVSPIIPPDEKAPPVLFTPQVTVPGSITVAGKTITFKHCAAGDKSCGIQITGDTVGQYVKVFFQFFAGAIAVMAVVMVMWGGFKRISAAGNSETISTANETIMGAISGLVLALLSYSLLNLINPALVTLKKLDVYQVKREELALQPVRFSEALSTDSTATSLAEKYRQMDCPSSDELEQGVQFFATGYYKPGYGEAEGYESFECNVAMQCWCPNNNAREKDPSWCHARGAPDWHPCVSFGVMIPYCLGTTSGRPPVELQTVAVDEKCVPRGTVFKISGSKVSDVNSATYFRADDTGGVINGRRLDIFMGTGTAAHQKAIRATGVVTIKKCPDNDPSRCGN